MPHAGAVLLCVLCQDAFGNPVPLETLRMTAGDDHVLRVSARPSGSQGGGGSVMVTAVGAGTTNLVVEGAGLRANLSATVPP